MPQSYRQNRRRVTASVHQRPDKVQTRLEQKLRELTSGDLAKPIVTMGLNATRFGVTTSRCA
jgi:hypothetical protein